MNRCFPSYLLWGTETASVFIMLLIFYPVMFMWLCHTVYQAIEHMSNRKRIFSIGAAIVLFFTLEILVFSDVGDIYNWNHDQRRWIAISREYNINCTVTTTSHSSQYISSVATVAHGHTRLNQWLVGCVEQSVETATGTDVYTAPCFGTCDMYYAYATRCLSYESYGRKIFLPDDVAAVMSNMYMLYFLGTGLMLLLFLCTMTCLVLRVGCLICGGATRTTSDDDGVVLELSVR